MRPRLYPDEKLEYFIDHYFEHNNVVGQIDATMLAKYVRETFGDTKIEYRHFTRSKAIKEKIQAINNVYDIAEKEKSKEVMVAFNPDKFLEAYKGNPRMMKLQLREFANRYEELNQRVIKYQDDCIRLENKLKELNESNEELKKKNKELRDKNQSLKKDNNALKSFKRFDESVQMLKYLKDNKLITSLNEETFKVILNNCNIGALDIDTEIDTDSENDMDITCEYGNIDNSFENVIEFKEVTQEINNSQNNVKSAMALMRERLKK